MTDFNVKIEMNSELLEEAMKKAFIDMKPFIEETVKSSIDNLSKKYFITPIISYPLPNYDMQGT